MFGLVFTRRYSMAHRLIADAGGKCAVPHGHNERVTVRLEAGEARRLDGVRNMVEPFETAKARWHRWIDQAVDHAFQLSDRDPLIDYFRDREPGRLAHLLITPGDPSTEMLAACFKAKLTAFLEDDGGRLCCVDVRIEETPTNAVTFSGDPADFLPESVAGDNRPAWWRRADMSINDLFGDTTQP
jgi:6-pyruvoyltetrahydropterin/6-carboxytetrahydropterin synthase